MTKKEFSTHLSDRWYFYVLWALAVLIISSWSITFAASPKKREKVSIFLTAYDCNTEGLYNYLNDGRPEYLKKVELNYYSPTNEYYSTFFQAYDQMADIIIIKGDYLDSVGYERYLSFSITEISNLCPDSYELVSKDETYYGVKIHKKGEEGGMLSEYITYTKTTEDEVLDDDYYLFIRRESLHMGEYNNSKLDGAISIIRKMLKYES